MHNNFYFLRKVTQSLEASLLEAVISECFSQNKDELILRFETSKNPFFLRANLLPDFCCLSFPATFNRARKNSVDLFNQLIGRKVLSIRQFQNERSFALLLADNITLLFKMHANRSNIILYENGTATELFKKNLVADQQLKLSELDRTIDWSFENFIAHEATLKNTYFTFGKIIWSHLEETGFNRLTSAEKWQVIQHLLSVLENPVYYVTAVHEIPHLSLISTGTILKELNNPIEALNTFFVTYTQRIAYAREKYSLLSTAKSKLTGSEKYYLKTTNRLKEIEQENHYKVWADIIMANLTVITSGSERVVLSNFYKDNEPVEIKLKNNISPQKNAELYYKKAKHQFIEIEHLHKSLATKEKEIAELKILLQHIESIDDLKQLKDITGTTRHKTEEKEKSGLALPYHQFEFNGYKIWVGKNAASNDELTLKHTFKDDLWLHAKDVAGSHVVIKYQAGKKIPKEVIEKAAQIAAFNSKRKNESLCPVAVTQKKYVRKRKGDPPGAVVVEREEVILVEPSIS